MGRIDDINAKKFLTAKDISVKYGWSPQLVQRYINKGYLFPIHDPVHRTKRYFAEDVEALAETIPFLDEKRSYLDPVSILRLRLRQLELKTNVILQVLNFDVAIHGTTESELLELYEDFGDMGTEEHLSSQDCIWIARNSLCVTKNTLSFFHHTLCEPMPVMFVLRAVQNAMNQIPRSSLVEPFYYGLHLLLRKADEHLRSYIKEDPYLEPLSLDEITKLVLQLHELSLATQDE